MKTATELFSQGEYGFIAEDNFQIGPLSGESKYLCGAWPGSYNDYPKPIWGKLLMRALPFVLTFSVLALAFYSYIRITALDLTASNNYWPSILSILTLPSILIFGMLISITLAAAFKDAFLAKQNEAQLFNKSGLTLLIAHQDYNESMSTHFEYYYPDRVNYDEAVRWQISKDAQSRLVLPLNKQWQLIHIPDMPSGKTQCLVKDIRSFYGRNN